jgi:sarcosine oxidase, subunit beta
MTASPHVVIIGAGALGMCAAINLAKQQARVPEAIRGHNL